MMDRLIDLGILRRIPAISTAPAALPLPAGAAQAGPATGAAHMVAAKAAEAEAVVGAALKQAAKKLA